MYLKNIIICGKLLVHRWAIFVSQNDERSSDLAIRSFVFLYSNRNGTKFICEGELYMRKDQHLESVDHHQTKKIRLLKIVRSLK